jgi:hypothetical protein
MIEFILGKDKWFVAFGQSRNAMILLVNKGNNHTQYQHELQVQTFIPSKES